MNIQRMIHMNVWEFLGISPTMDVKVIKRAYAKKLRGAHPEDDIAAFQALQEAYQAALKEAQYLSTVAVEDDDTINNATNIDNANLNVESIESEPSTVQGDRNNRSEHLSKQVQNGLPYSTHVEENNFPVWFMEQIDAIYGDFNARIDASNWKVEHSVRCITYHFTVIESIS